MFRPALALFLLLGLWLAAAPRAVHAAEPYREFLAALRDGGLDEHFEAAFEYLDLLEKDPKVPTDVRDVLGYERALVLVAQSRRATSVELQRRLLADAEAALQGFVKSHGSHPLAGEANFQLAQLILQKAWTEIFAALDPANEQSRLDLQTRARKFADQAKTAFAAAEKRLKTEYDKFPSNDADLPSDERAKKAQVEGQYLRSQYEQAMCLYATAQSYRDPDVESQPQIFRNRVNDAADAFEKLYEKYRQQLFGRYCRVMQAKCLEEQDKDLRPALGIYDDVLDQLEDGNPDIDALKDKALRYRLAAMNHPTLKEYALIDERATAWMQKHKARLRTDSGLGIAYEHALALRELAKEDGITATRKSQLLGRAQELANILARSSAEFRGKGIRLQREVAGMRNRKSGPIASFTEAMTEADGVMADVASLQQEYTQAVTDGDPTRIAEKRKALFERAAQLGGVYDQALLLADNTSEARQVASARTRLAYTYYLQERYLEAATVADYQVRKFSQGTGVDAAKEAAYIGLAALDIVYRRAPKDDREFERVALGNAAEAILSRWPDSERGGDARMILGSVAFDNGDYLAAIDDWSKIKEGASQFGPVAIKIGYAYWQNYAREANRDEKERPAPDQLSKWKGAAIQNLERGIDVLGRGASASRPPDELILGKLTLATIRNLDGLYSSKGKTAGARELLTEQPFAVIEAVEVPEGQKRPRDPSSPKSRQMASYAYQQLLKAYIGLKDLDKAQAARMRLEEIAAGGSDDAEALTQIFVDFGRELQNQLNQLRAQGETVRVAELRDGFESFLNDIRQRTEGQNWNTRLWIAETFSSLGESAENDPGIAKGYYSKAAEAYRQMLDDPSKAPSPDHVGACRLQLGRVLAKQENFKGAEDAILEVLKEKPGSVSGQMAAADLYRNWGDAGEVDAAQKYALAISGQKTPIEVWGYYRIGRDVQREMLQEPDETRRESLDRLRMDARWRQAQSLRKLALLQSSDDDRIRVLNQAARAVMALGNGKIARSEYGRFNELFHDVQTDLGVVAVDLDEADKLVLVDPDKKRPAAAGPTVPTDASGAIPPSKANVAVISGLVLVGLMAVGGILFYANQQQKKQLAKLAQLAAGSAANEPRSSRPNRPGPPP